MDWKSIIDDHLQFLGNKFIVGIVDLGDISMVHLWSLSLNL